MRKTLAKQRSVAAVLAARIADTGSDPTATQAAAAPGWLAQPLAAPVTGRIDLWERLDDAVDPALLRPKLAADIETNVIHVRWGEDYAIVANPRDFIHLQLTKSEADLLPLMDGTRTIGDIVVMQLEGSGGFDISGVAGLVYELHHEGFLGPKPVDIAEALAEAQDPTRGLRRVARDFAKNLSIEWHNPDPFVRRIYHAGLRWAFTPVGVGVASTVALAGFVAFCVAVASGRYSFAASSAPVDSVVLILLGFVLTFGHEMGHAAALVHYDRRVKGAGFLLYFGSPAFYVESSDGVMLDRGQRIIQSAAGPIAESVLAGIASLTVWIFPGSAISSLLFKFSILNYFVIFENLIPLLELDGYWILSELIQVPDLRKRSLGFIQHDLLHKLRTRERFTGRETGIALYGIFGIAFTILSLWTAAFFWRAIFGRLIIGLWHAGAVGRTLLVVLVLVIAGPLVRGAISLVRAFIRRCRTVARKVRFRFESSWRVEAAELIDDLPVFEDLPEEVLGDLAGRVRLLNFSPGEPIFRQGDRADAFYVVRRGAVHIQEEDPETGAIRTLHTAARGEAFGELGLVEGARRSATVRADRDVEVFAIDKGTFDRLLSDQINAPDFGPTLHSLAELRSLPAFGHLSARGVSEVFASGRWESFSPGQDILREGEVGDAFYAVGSGQVDIVQAGTVIRTIGSGAYFGEIALLRDVPRTATVRARTPLRVFRLPRAGFERLIAGAFTRGTLRPALGQTWEH